MTSRSLARHSKILLLTGLLVTIAATYWTGLGGGYAFDDYPNIVDNADLHVTEGNWPAWARAIFSSPSSDLQRPLAMFSLAINHYFTGLDPWPMKLTNLCVHLINTLLVFGLISSLLRAAARKLGTDASQFRWAPLFCASAWALAPINLMSVLFVVQRMESLSHTFVFAGLWMYVAGREHQMADRHGTALIVSGLVGGVLLGVLAKESAVLLPLYAVLVEAAIFRFRNHLGALNWPLTVLFIALLVVPGIGGTAWLFTKVAAPSAWAGRDFTLAERLLTEPRVVLDYLRWTWAPNLGQLSLYHDDYPISRSWLSPPMTIIAIAGIVALAGFALWRLRQRPLFGLGILWFLSAHLLTASFLPLELVFEHRNYFASLGLMLAVTDLLLIWQGPSGIRRMSAFVALFALIFWTGVTHLRAREWSDPVRFSSTEALKHPQSPRATYDLARTLIILNGYRTDSPLTPRVFAALEQARAAPRGSILADQATLIFAARTGTPLRAEWWQSLQDKLRERPAGPQDISALAAMTDCNVAEQCHFPPQDMVSSFAVALSHGPNPKLLNVYGNYALNVLFDTDLALRLWNEACELAPLDSQYHENLAKLLSVLGRRDEARKHIAAIRRLGRMGQNEALADSLEQRLRENVP